MDDGTHEMAIVPLHAQVAHHLGIAHAHDATVYPCTDAPTAQFLDRLDAASVGGLTGESLAQRRRYGVGGIVFDMGGEMQQFALVAFLGMDCHHRELAVGEGACLVEDHGVEPRQGVHVVAALDEYAATRRPAKSAEEGKRHADDQRTGTRHDEEDKGPVEPLGEDCHAAEEEGRNHSQHDGRDDHDGGIDTGKAGDKRLAARLLFIGALDKMDDTRHGAFAKGAGGTNPEHTREIDAARDYLVALADIARHALAGESHRVERSLAREDDAVERHALAGAYHDGLAHSHLIGRNGLHRPSALHMGGIGAHLYEMGNAVAAAALGVALKELAHLEEEHHKDRLGKLGVGAGHEPDGEGTDGGDCHQKVFIEHASMHYALGCLAQRRRAHEQIGNQIDQQQLPGGQRQRMLYPRCDSKQQRCRKDKSHLATRTIMMMVMMM